MLKLVGLGLFAGLMGGLLGMVMAVSNLYTTLKLGWAFGVAITACILAYAIWTAFQKIGVARPAMAVLAAAMLSAAGCDQTVKRTLPSEIRTLYVSEYRNLTDQNLLPSIMLEELRRAFRLDGRLNIVDDSRAASAVLDGTFTEYVKQPARYDRNNVVQEYRIRLVVDLVLTDMDRKRVLWTEKGPLDPATRGATIRKLERWANYVVVPATGIPVETETDAQRRALRGLAEDTVLRVIEGW
mgnify:CR=1 FL=1